MYIIHIFHNILIISIPYCIILKNNIYCEVLISMKKSKIVLLSVIAITIIFLLFSCSNESNLSDSSEKPLSDIETTQIENIDERSLFNPPETANFDGYEFRILTKYNDEKNYTFVTNEQNGDSINDAVYLRNRTVEDIYNVTISVVEGDLSHLQRAVTAGDDICDIQIASTTSEAVNSAAAGYLFNLNSIDTLRFDMPWWDQRMNRELTFYDKLYTVTGDFTTRDDFCTMIVAYNQKLYDLYIEENIYDIVSSGKWTFDTMWNMVKGVTQDLNGDGELNQNDQWGFMSETAGMYYFYAGSGFKPIQKFNDEYRIMIDDTRSFEILEKVMPMATERNESNIVDDGKINDAWNVAYAMFQNDQILFRSSALADLALFRDMDTNFSALPIPKYDEVQDEYYSLVSYNDWPICVPNNISDAERTGLILEALAYESRFTLRESFYEVFLNEKIMRDEESKQLLNIVFDSKTFDLEWITNTCGLLNITVNICKTGNNNLASEYAKIQESANVKLETFLTKFKDI